MDINKSIDSVIDITKETSEKITEKTKEFHDKYISKFVPDCGKYGNAAKFAVEILPGVSEYNAVREGDWKAFALAAGIDIAAIGIGAFTAGAGYGLVKGGDATAKASVKIATKEIAKASSKKIVKEVAEEGTKKAIKEVAEKSIKSISREAVEKKIKKEIIETASKNIEKGVDKATDISAKKIIRYIECRNSGLLDDIHPETGIKFVKKIVDDGTGTLCEGVFPKFSSLFDAKIPKEIFKESNAIQFKEANKQLLESINKNPILKKKFSLIQIEQIKDGVKYGIAPDGFVWHHSEELGVLQLVNETVHRKTAHSGGRLIWGGGY